MNSADVKVAGDGVRRRRGLSATMVVVVLALAGVIALSVFAARVWTELNSLRATSSDNVQWTLAQLEVEYLAMTDALEEAVDGGPESIATLRRRFDVFYSRVATIAAGDVFAVLTDAEPGRSNVAAVQSALARSVPILDSPDLQDRLDSLRPVLLGLRDRVRSIALAAMSEFAVTSDVRRFALSSLILETALIAIALMVLLGAVLVALMRQNRIARARAAELRLAKERFETTLNASPNAIMVTDANGVVLEYNPAAEATFGYSRDEAVGRNIAGLVVPAHLHERHRLGMARFHRTGKGTVVGRGAVAMEASRAGGEIFPVELSLASANSPDGPMFIAYIRDITDRLRVERELTEARDKALAAARAQAQFLAVMSHEMRTPLNGVLAILDLLGGTSLSPKQRQYVEVATRSGEILQHHVDDVLDITRIESGKLVLAEAPFLLADLAEEVARINRPAAETRRNTIAVDVDAPKRPVLGDRLRLGQVLLNLVGNAVKFTEGGQITLSVRSVGRSDDAELVEFRVSDTGIGIPSADSERIFDDFVTLDPSYRRAASGYGLGLSISRRIVRAMHGEIRVESTLGAGSTFYARVPLRFADVALAEPAPTQAPVPAAAGMSVLLVEDNEVNRFAAREMLSVEGCRISEAEDGLAGVALASQERFDLILMDLSMPHCDGIEATRRIREGDGLSADVTIVGLTAHALPDEVARLMAAGMQDCLRKPLRQRDLRALLARLAPAAATAAVVEPAPADVADMPGDEDALDPSVLAELRDVLSARVFGQRVEAFERELVALPGALRAVADDLPALGALAHRAAGSAAVFGAVVLCDVLGTLEDACREGETEFVEPLLHEVEAAGAAARTALARTLVPAPV